MPANHGKPPRKLAACLISGLILLLATAVRAAGELVSSLQPALIADFRQCAWRKLIEAIQHFGHQLSKRLERIVAFNQDNDSQRKCAEVLLILEILIGCEKYVELDGGSAKKRSIVQAGPTTLGHG